MFGDKMSRKNNKLFIYIYTYTGGRNGKKTEM